MAKVRHGISKLLLLPAVPSLALACSSPPADHAPAAPIDFSAPVTLAAPIHPNTIAAADLDGDGRIDIAVPGFVEPSLYVHGAGGVTHAPLPAGVGEISAVDLDGDGLVELVATEGEADQVELFGAGPDLTPVSLGVLPVAAPSATTAADLDGDGDLDLAVTRFHPATVTPLLHTDAGFVAGPPTPLPAGAAAIASVRVEGRLLLAVVSSQRDELVVVDPAGPAPWPIVARAPTASWPASVAAADLDDDGQDELLGACNVGDTMFVARLEPGATGLALTLSQTPLPGGPFGVAAADLDRDHDLDVAVALKSGGAVAIFENDGAGILVRLADHPVGAGPTPVVAVDVDDDGAIDLITADAFSDTASILHAKSSRSR